MAAISPGMVEGILVIGVFVCLVGGLAVGLSDPDARIWAATCVGGTLVALLGWLLLFRFLFGVAA